ncbi:hypothetical protein U8V72_19925 [Priestia filamentosa]|uniref:hypothetical protein n=1 Tax=Priestia filamentosa TaxID=1402861 RepID=UPI00397C5555
MSFEHKKVKNFDRMSPEEKFEYATKWDEYQQVVAATLLVALERRVGISDKDVEFSHSFVEVTQHNQEIATHVILDVHEELGVKVDETELQPYEVYDTLLDFVLVVSAEMTDEVLGYISMFDELEMAFRD